MESESFLLAALGIQSYEPTLAWLQEAQNECLVSRLQQEDSNSNDAPLSDESNDNDNVNNDDDDIDPTTQKKRKRQDIRKLCETKRRNKFTEQLDALRSLLYVDHVKHEATTRPKITREMLMSSAITEIVKLREQVTQLQVLLTDSSDIMERIQTGKYPTNVQLPLTENLIGVYTSQDLERAFQTMLAREVQLMFEIQSQRNEECFFAIQTMRGIAKQIGKQEYHLCVGALEQLFHLCVENNLKEVTRCAEQNWSTYQAIKKMDQNLVLFLDTELGPYLLAQMSLLENMSGNFNAGERTFRFAKELTKRFGHRGTFHGMLMGIVWNLRGAVSISTAHKIRAFFPNIRKFRIFGLMILALAQVANGQHKEGLNTVEHALAHMVGRQLYIGPVILDCYIQTRSIERGLALVNYLIRKGAEFHIEGFYGKPELLRQKAVLLMMKKFPEFTPDPIDEIESNIKEFVEFVETEAPASTVEQLNIFGPAPPPPFQIDQVDNSSGAEEIEPLLRSALELAQERGQLMIHLRCALDLTRYFILSGDAAQALVAAQTVKNCMAKMQGSEDSRELRKAKRVMASVEELQRLIQKFTLEFSHRKLMC